MALAVGRIAPRQGKGSQICHDHRIHARIVQQLQMLRQAGHLVVAGHGIDGAMDPDAPLMGKGHRLPQLLRGEVSGKGPHPEGGAGQIHRIGTVEHRHPQPLHIPRRSQQLRLFPFIQHSHHC